MIASMTGFGQSDGAIDGMVWTWEVRSVNNRGLDVRLKLPPAFDALEALIRADTAQLVHRGSLTITLTVRRAERAALVLDQLQLANLLAMVQDVAAQIPGAAPPRPEAMLAMPGVLRTATADEVGITPEQLDAVRSGFATALSRLMLARAEEGARLHAVVTGQLTQISSLRTHAQQEAAVLPATLQARLLASLQPLLADTTLSPDRLAQEVALLATRADVQEELDRLASHIEGAEALLTAAGPVGRRFDFLVQEFMREANTLCAKSASIPLTRLGLGMKASIEQMREQVQNVE